MGVPDRTVTQNPQSKTKAPKGAAARTATVLLLSGVILFSPSGFPLSHKRPTQGNVGLAFWVGIIHNFLPSSLCRICRKFR